MCPDWWFVVTQDEKRRWATMVPNDDADALVVVEVDRPATAADALRRVMEQVSTSRTHA